MVDAQYPTTSTDASTDWSIIIAEELDSSGGTAGDASTLNITSTSPTNKFIELRVPALDEMLDSKDPVQHIAGNVHIGTIIGQVGKLFTLKNMYIIDKKITEFNALRTTIENWMESGNTQVGKTSLYMAVKGDQAGSTKYFTFKVDGTRQNWARIMIRKAQNRIYWNKFQSTMTLEYAEN